MIELESRHPLASANRGTRCYPLRIESKEVSVQLRRCRSIGARATRSTDLTQMIA